ncbi:M15 family metallopeptidase [Microlunatus sp. Gsoil 973]|uniref:M15 family metallopeptidase n=1 Tax=Microlunatus sp. Gsoil 973 TaxID=2672569 RepID=UPI0012B5030F|nr:M15 family metallopeptidase [Microlunatus sp. Gsoil 973]QGN34959.1 peptidase M15 [Microlunatus sp. Gsoil 973]
MSKRAIIRAAPFILGAALVGFFGYHSLGHVDTSSPVQTFRNHSGSLGPADGEVPDGATVFDDIPAVTNLQPDLLAALRRAATNASREGIIVGINSAWRSPAYQEHLLQQAIATYGSADEAARWVATPDRSAHVSGAAVDVGRSDATRWLSKHEAAYGLCQIYRNEPWHYELRPEAVDHGCPPMYADAAHDPRLRH